MPALPVTETCRLNVTAWSSPICFLPPLVQPAQDAGRVCTALLSFLVVASRWRQLCGREESVTLRRVYRGDLRALSCCGSKLSHLSALNGCGLWSLSYTCNVDTKAIGCVGCLEQQLVQPRSPSARPAPFPSPWPLSVRTPVCVTPLPGLSLAAATPVLLGRWEEGFICLRHFWKT